MQPEPEPQPVGRVTRAEEALPLDEQAFSHADAVALLKGSAASHIAGYISVAAAIATLTLNLQLLDHGEEDTSSDTREARIFNVACAATFATGQVIPLAKTTRDRFVASLHDMDGAPKGLKALRGTTESYITAAVFFIASIVFCVYAVRAHCDDAHGRRQHCLPNAASDAGSGPRGHDGPDHELDAQPVLPHLVIGVGVQIHARPR